MKQHHFDKQDEARINLALNLVKKNIGITLSNPIVGSVLVKNNTIISTGVTGKNGVPHSENIAIIKAGNNTKGSTLYVTLEPCCHQGKTPPCTDLIIESGISRVVVAITDPDSRVNGLGIKKLQEAGIEVVVGVLQEQARKINCGFFSNKTSGRPFITLKLATSLDGKIATKNGDSKWITSEKSLQYSHYLRAKNDAILVGANTLRKDNPMLNCRISGLESYSPKRIILSSSLDININSKIIQSAKQIPTYIVTNNSNTKEFVDLGLQIIELSSLNNKVDLYELVKKLGNYDINNLLIEGGGNVATQFLKAKLVDKLIWIQAAKIVGDDGISGVKNLDINQISQSLEFKRTSVKDMGDDLVLEFVPQQNYCL